MSTSPSSLIRPQFRTVDGLRIRYADSGGSHRANDPAHRPWPESIYAFAGMWDELAERPGLRCGPSPGFGAWEGRPDVMSPRAMGEFLAQLVAEVDVGVPYVVAPDVGTSAALFAAPHVPSSSKA